MRPQEKALLNWSYPTSSPTKLLFISEARAGECRSCDRLIASVLPLSDWERRKVTPLFGSNSSAQWRRCRGAAAFKGTLHPTKATRRSIYCFNYPRVLKSPEVLLFRSLFDKHPYQSDSSYKQDDNKTGSIWSTAKLIYALQRNKASGLNIKDWITAWATAAQILLHYIWIIVT